MNAPRLSWRARLRRWRWWIAAVCLIIAVRVALPFVLRSVVASQASQALHARVDVGDVDLALWKGGVALENVAVRAADAPPPPAEPLPENAPAFSDNPPLVAFKRFAVELRYWPLFSKTIQLRDIQLDSPRVALDRLADGDLNLMALVPKSEVAVEAGATPGAAGGTPTPTAVAETAASPWKIGLDRFVLRDGRLRFRDLKLEGSEPVELGIDEISVQEVALSPGVYGEPARLHVKLALEGGVIDVSSQLRLLEQGFAVSCDVNAQRVPLSHARLYVPKVGWSDLKGELDLAMTYEMETGAKNALRGTIGLRDVAVAVPKLEDVAVGWKSLAVTIETIDLMAQRAAITDVALDGARIDVRAQGDQPLPLLAGSAPAGGAAAPTPEATESPTPADASKTDEPAETPKPWEWSVASVRIADSAVHVLSEQPPLEVGLDVTATNLASAADAIGHLSLGLALAPATIEVDGDFRIAAPAFGGTIKIADLGLPPLVAVSGALEQTVLPSATFRADLAVQAGLPAKSGATAEPDLLRVVGTLGIGDLRTAPPGQSGLTIAAQGIELAIDDLAVPGVIPLGRKAPAGAELRTAVRLSLTAPRVELTGEQPLSIAAESLALGLSDVVVPAGLAGLAPPESMQPLRAAATLSLTAPRVERGGEQPLSFAADSLALGLTDVAVPAGLAGGPAESAQPVHAAVTLDLGAPHVALPSSELAVEAKTIKLAVSDASLTAIPPDGTLAGTPPAHVALQLDVTEAKATIAEGKQLAAGAQSIGLQLAELTLPGLAIGPSPIDTGEPLHAVATLTLAQPRAVRGDGKEFSVAAKSIAVPVTDLKMSGVFAAPTEAPPAAPASPPLRAALADVWIDAPAIRLTRTNDGIILPVAAASPPSAPAPKPSPAPASAPSPAPAASPPAEITVASLKITRGVLDFTDRAVKPPFQTRYDPIELDARNLKYPNPSVKPLRIELTSSDQGKIIMTGDIGPQGGQLDFKMEDFALAPFNSYATTYSPYGISDGALEIKTTAKFNAGKYDVTNAITLHQFDLAGAEGDSKFEQQFGIPLTMALALLRDAGGDIDLNIPMQVDQSGGSTVDVVSVVRSALRQALMGAIESPLKLVGGVIGVGGKSGAVAPAPIAFPLGRAEPTSAGRESADRLAAFLKSRPAMAVQLDTAITVDDVRWIREQALRSEWTEEGFFARSFAFVTQRGPRERIGDYLRARGQGDGAELSPEDAATLQKWLDERSPPSAAQLQLLATNRLAAVTAVLKEQGIDAARVESVEPGGETVDGAPVVKIRFRPLSGAVQARPGLPTTPEEGQ